MELQLAPTSTPIVFHSLPLSPSSLDMWFFFFFIFTKSSWIYNWMRVYASSWTFFLSNFTEVRQFFRKERRKTNGDRDKIDWNHFSNGSYKWALDFTLLRFIGSRRIYVGDRVNLIITWRELNIYRKCDVDYEYNSNLLIYWH